MDTIEEIRLQRLAELLTEGHTQADIARAMNKSQKQVSQWFGKGSKRAISSATARELERVMLKPRGWLDHPRHLNDSAAESHAPAIHGVKSHLLTLDQDILHDAITLLGYDEDHAGEYTPREHSARLAELYARLAADGGRLTTQHNREFTEEVHQRSQGSTHGKPTKAPARRQPNNH